MTYTQFMLFSKEERLHGLILEGEYLGMVLLNGFIYSLYCINDFFIETKIKVCIEKLEMVYIIPCFENHIFEKYLDKIEINI